jgi:ABC-type sugar transport system ATPase subunit
LARVFLDKVNKFFDGQVEAVKNLTLEVPNGSLVCLLGPSGCGKTTTMKLIAGLILPTSGSVSFDDRDVTELPAEERNVAMTFQSPVIYPTMSVIDNISFPLEVRRFSKEEIKKRVTEAAEFLDLKEHLNVPARRLDAGLKQRVALARALVREPNILLLDEPLTNIDPRSRIELRTKIKTMHTALKVTCLYVTHDQAEALTLADTVGVMNLGEIVQYDTPEGLYSKPINKFVAWFIGNPGMNLLDATYREIGPRSVIDFGDFQVEIDRATGDIIREKLPSGELTLGIRPEHVQLSQRQMQGVRGKCTLVEELGPIRIALLKIGSRELRAKTETHLNEGDELWIGFPREKIRIFDRAGNLVV